LLLINAQLYLITGNKFSSLQYFLQHKPISIFNIPQILIKVNSTPNPICWFSIVFGFNLLMSKILRSLLRQYWKSAQE